MNRFATLKPTSWVDIVLLVVIGLVGIGAGLFIAFAVAPTTPHVPRGPVPALVVPSATPSPSVKASQTPSAGAGTTAPTQVARTGSSQPQAGSGGSNGGPEGTGSPGGGSSSHPVPPSPPVSATHSPIIVISLPPIDVPPIIRVSVPPIVLG